MCREIVACERGHEATLSVCRVMKRTVRGRWIGECFVEVAKVGIDQASSLHQGVGESDQVTLEEQDAASQGPTNATCTSFRNSTTGMNEIFARSA